MFAKLKYAILLTIAVTVISVLVNSICLIPSPIKIVGDGKLWVSFFGSILGGVISAGVALYVFYESIIQSKNEKKFQIEKEKINELRMKLARITESLNTNELVDELGRIGLKLEASQKQNTINHDYIDNVIRILEKKENRICHEANLFELEYGITHEKEPNSVAFYSNYKAEIVRVANAIDGLIKTLYTLSNIKSTDTEKASACMIINTILESLKNNSSTYILKHSKTWLEAEYKKLNVIEQQITK